MKTQAYLALLLVLGCRPTVHGNGAVEGSEQCDDGNANDGDGCNISCELETCGDGLINNGNLEQCDDGNQDNDDGCSSVCRRERCGDGIVNNVKEQCDDDNVDPGDGCNSRCQFEFCGDGIVNNKTETCDDGQRVDSGCHECQLPPEPKVVWNFLAPQGVNLRHYSTSNWVATKDINKDAVLDLVALDKDGSVFVSLGKGDGTFQEHFSMTVSISTPMIISLYYAALGDFNGDGWVDLMAYGYNQDSVYLYLGTDTFTFGAPDVLTAKENIYSVAVTDFDKDGKDDAVVAIKKELQIWRGSNSGFKAPYALSKEAFSGLVVADVNGDTYPDIVAENWYGLSIFLGSKSGSFSKPQTLSIKSYHRNNLIAGDINNDGVSDILISGEKLQTVTYTSKGGFVFSEGATIASLYEAPNLSACDFNDDGNLDVAVLGARMLGIYLGSGKGTFKGTYQAPTDSSWGPSLAAGELNKDGECDIITSGLFPKVWLGNGKSKTK